MNDIKNVIKELEKGKKSMKKVYITFSHNT